MATSDWEYCDLISRLLLLLRVSCFFFQLGRRSKHRSQLSRQEKGQPRFVQLCLALSSGSSLQAMNLSDSLLPGNLLYLHSSLSSLRILACSVPMLLLLCFSRRLSDETALGTLEFKVIAFLARAEVFESCRPENRHSRLLGWIQEGWEGGISNAGAAPRSFRNFCNMVSNLWERNFSFNLNTCQLGKAQACHVV